MSYIFCKIFIFENFGHINITHTFSKMSVFDLSQTLSSINFGVTQQNTVELIPLTGSVSNCRLGYQPASGTSIFQFKETNNWFSPALSWFQIKLRFADLSNNALSVSDGIAYVKGWPAVIFSQVEFRVNGQQVELCTNVPIVDSVTLAASASYGYYQTLGDNIGNESLMTRIQNTSRYGSGNSNFQEVIGNWRPPLSVLNTACLPPGAEYQIHLTFNAQAEQQIIESLAPKIAGVDYVVYVDSITYYKCSLMPDPSLTLPSQGIIELTPAVINTYSVINSNMLQVQTPVDATCNKLFVCFQDNNLVNSFGAGQNGYNPFLDFHAGFSNGATDFASFLQQFWVELPEIGVRFPSNTYNFVGLASGSKSDFYRAYKDFINCNFGDSSARESGLQFGSFDKSKGAHIVAPNATPAGVFQLGTPDNEDEAKIVTSAVTALTATSYNQTCLYGYIGRKFILCIPIIRPKNRPISTVTINCQFSGQVTNVLMHVIQLSSRALVVQNAGNNMYQYNMATTI